jgi:glycosyltransferase involved in cell wall biosynthesis
MINSINQIPTISDYLNIPAHSLRKRGGSRLINVSNRSPNNPLVSVITIVRNRKDTLPQTIESITAQTYQNIEYIIIDGFSTDGTSEVIRQFDDKISIWISEPDKGTADAYNKGLSLASGDFIFWLCSDDWIEPGFIASAVNFLRDSRAEFVYGDLSLYKKGKPVRLCRGNKDYTKSLLSGYPRINFTTMVIKRECFQEFGLIDTSYKFFNDYELALRFHLNGARGIYNNSLMVHKRIGGMGESLSLESISEFLRLLRQYRLPKTKALTNYLYFLVRGRIGKFCNKLSRKEVKL